MNLSDKISVSIPKLDNPLVAAISVVSWNNLKLGTTAIDSSIISISATSKDGSAQKLQNLTSPFVFKNAIGVSKNASWSPECIYWDTVAREWSSAGCVISLFDNSSISCSCNHLTDFAARFAAIGEENREIFANAGNVFSEEGLRRYASFYIFTGTFFGVLLGIFAYLTYINNKDSLNYARILAKYPDINILYLLKDDPDDFFIDRYYPKIKLHPKRQKETPDVSPYKGKSFWNSLVFIWLHRIYYQHSYFAVFSKFDPRVSKQLRGVLLFIVILNALFITCLLYGYSRAGSTEPMSISESIVLSVLTAGINIPVIQFFSFLVNKIGYVEYAWRYPYLNEEIKRRHHFENQLKNIPTETLLLEIMKLTKYCGESLDKIILKEQKTGFTKLKDLFSYINSEISLYVENQHEIKKLEGHLILDVRNSYEPANISYMPVHTQFGAISLCAGFLYIAWCFIYILLFGAKESNSNNIFYTFISSQLINIIISQPLALFLMPIFGHIFSLIFHRKNTKHSYSNIYFFSDPDAKADESTALSVSLAYWLFLRGIAQTNSYYTNKIAMEIAIAPSNAIVRSLDETPRIDTEKPALDREKIIAGLYFLNIICT